MTDQKTDQTITCLGCGITHADINRLNSYESTSTFLRWTLAAIPETEMALPLCGRCEQDHARLAAAVFAAIGGARLVDQHAPHATAIAGRLLDIYGDVRLEQALKTIDVRFNDVFKMLLMQQAAQDAPQEPQDDEPTPAPRRPRGWPLRFAGAALGAVVGLSVVMASRPTALLKQYADLILAQIGAVRGA
jgi:hypothetical protein